MHGTGGNRLTRFECLSDNFKVFLDKCDTTAFAPHFTILNDHKILHQILQFEDGDARELVSDLGERRREFCARNYVQTNGFEIFLVDVPSRNVIIRAHIRQGYTRVHEDQ
jgi:hypothetical protein